MAGRFILVRREIIVYPYTVTCKSLKVSKIKITLAIYSLLSVISNSCFRF
jgi:hypothetical protein